MKTTVSNATNYLVPASGQTHVVTYEGTYSPIPFLIDWRQFKIDNFPFKPQGVYVDNTLGSGDLTITIKPLNYDCVTPPGAKRQFQFPAPIGQTAEITGNGDAIIYFVDYPVLPDFYNLSMLEKPASFLYGQLNSGVSSVTLTPTVVDKSLKRVELHISDDVTIAVAANAVLTITVNGVLVWKVSPWIEASHTGTAHFSWNEKTIEFEDLDVNIGSGDIVLSIDTALTGGIIDINCFIA